MARWVAPQTPPSSADARHETHGIDALALTALPGTLTHAGEKLTVDFTPLSRLMGITSGVARALILDRDLPRPSHNRATDTKSDDPAVQRLAASCSRAGGAPRRRSGRAVCRGRAGRALCKLSGHSKGTPLAWQARVAPYPGPPGQPP